MVQHGHCRQERSAAVVQHGRCRHSHIWERLHRASRQQHSGALAWRCSTRMGSRCRNAQCNVLEANVTGHMMQSPADECGLRSLNEAFDLDSSWRRTSGSLKRTTCENHPRNNCWRPECCRTGTITRIKVRLMCSWRVNVRRGAATRCRQRNRSHMESVGSQAGRRTSQEGQTSRSEGQIRARQ